MPSRVAVLLIVLLLTMAAGASIADDPVADDVVVVAHPDVPVDTISLRELQRIYLGKSTRWAGGERIKPVLLDTDPVLATFITDYLDRTAENFSVYWKRMVFTGKGRPPRAFGDRAELAFYVRVTPGAIGFLPAAADRTGLKVVHVH